MRASQGSWGTWELEQLLQGNKRYFWINLEEKGYISTVSENFGEKV